MPTTVETPQQPSGAHTPTDARPSPSRSAPASRRQPRPIGYVRPLDGLRAVAVALVVVYHLGYAGVAGGYIGVEVFFIISGWLVCALLMNEHQRTGRIALGGFWLRRIRRLVPAMAAVIAATVTVASVVDPGRLALLRTQAIAALGYHLNWRLVADDQSYFDAAAGPTALEHLWSLSIEEQFYLLFPLLAAGVLVRRSRSGAVRLVLGLAVASTLLRLLLVDPGADPSRIYFGTDTRLSGLLLGVALGLFWTPNRLRPHDSRRFTATLDAIALAGALVIAWYALRVDEHGAAAFRTDFTLVQLGTLLLLAVVVYPAPTRTARVLSAGPLVWVGERSYGIYLIHWPVIVFLSDAPGEQPDGPLSVVLQVALILGLAALSYRYLEQPIRRAGVRPWCRGVAGRLSGLYAGRPAVAVAVVVALVLAGTATVSVAHGVATASSPTATDPTSVVIDAGGVTMTTARPADQPATTLTTAAASDADPAPAAAPAPTTTTTAPPAPAPAPPAFRPTTAIGDSVLVGAAPVLAHRLGGALSVDAEVGRQLADVVDLVAAKAADGSLGEVVVLHLGTNGPFTGEEIDELMAAAGPDRLVLLVNVLVPRRWEGEVNAALAAAAGRYPNARVVDWRSLATSEAGLIRDDGYHLTPNGAERYADLLVGQIPTG
jgi:peptidoglycan/LPS O-acetylase OafA/YrhL